ncbi:XdhC family protein [Caldimonas tepidiphila]|uniref:XdhC family protein n=1 Tax=Caldimonas tepidiphila TaxID=2315841 RepID=UPI000E5B6C31|nr:XdhC family protein [Caldimonas tepidiphila]
MEAMDLAVLRAAADWSAAGHRCWLATVVETYGSAPRPPGSMAVLRDDGRVVGSVSGGCVEDDLVDWLRRDAAGVERARAFVYGRDAEERARLRLPCGGHLRVWLEPAPRAEIDALLAAIGGGMLMRREIDLASGASGVAPSSAGDATALAGERFVQLLGPTRRLILVGASEVSRYLAPIARTMDYRVTVIDPREEYLDTWPHPDCELVREMPDDAIAARLPDAHTAVVALSHDPKLDDLALLEALKSAAFYVGAMGSLRTTEARRERLALFDLTPAEIARLRGPVGVDVGARTPPEIAVSVAADLVRVAREAETAARRGAPACTAAVAMPPRSGAAVPECGARDDARP